MKEQDKTPAEQLSDVEICNLPKFRAVIVKIIKDTGKRMEAQIRKRQETFNKA